MSCVWFQCSDQWWLHQPDLILDNFDYKLRYTFNIFTDPRIMARRPNLDNQLKFTKLNDVACVMNRHVVEKQALPYLF